MAWFDEAVFYHIYPLGLLGCPHENSYGEPVHRLTDLAGWVEYIADMGFTGIYIGPLFESEGHGYETTDYKKLDSRLGTNEDLKAFVADCHKRGIRVILDGVFNHTGRNFFAFRDIREHRESSRYLGWYSGVNLGGNNSFNDGFSYDNWGGYDLLVRLNQKNPEVQDYIADVIRFWVSEFDIDGLRLDAADVLDFDFMQMLSRVGSEVKPDFYLMGEVIHGEYIRWERDAHLHAVTNYHLHKALYSGHNDHNYFEIAHTVKRLYDMGGGDPLGLRLYNFSDNHDVERIVSRLSNRAHFRPLHILLYTLPGVPSMYYGSEFGIEGKKGGGDDWPIRPALTLKDCLADEDKRPFRELIKALCHIRTSHSCLSYGSYEQLLLTNRQYAFIRRSADGLAVVAVNNDDSPAQVNINVPAGRYTALIDGITVDASGGNLSYTLPPSGGDIFVPEDDDGSREADIVPPSEIKPAQPAPAVQQTQEPAPKVQQSQESAPAQKTPEQKPEPATDGQSDIQKNAREIKKEPSQSEKTPEPVPVPSSKSYEEMTVEELQSAILQKMAKNGPVTDDMKRSVYDNVWHDSLVNWVKSFN